MLSVLSLLGLVSFLKRISLLLDYFCIDSMTMPSVWSFWVGLYVSSFLFSFFVGPWALVYSFFFLFFLISKLRNILTKEGQALEYTKERKTNKR